MVRARGGELRRGGAGVCERAIKEERGREAPTAYHGAIGGTGGVGDGRKRRINCGGSELEWRGAWSMCARALGGNACEREEGPKFCGVKRVRRARGLATLDIRAVGLGKGELGCDSALLEEGYSPDKEHTCQQCREREGKERVADWLTTWGERRKGNREKRRERDWAGRRERWSARGGGKKGEKNKNGKEKELCFCPENKISV